MWPRLPLSQCHGCPSRRISTRTYEGSAVDAVGRQDDRRERTGRNLSSCHVKYPTVEASDEHSSAVKTLGIRPRIAIFKIHLSVRSSMGPSVARPAAAGVPLVDDPPVIQVYILKVKLGFLRFSAKTFAFSSRFTLICGN